MINYENTEILGPQFWTFTFKANDQLQTWNKVYMFNIVD